MPVSSSCHYPCPWLLACPSLAITAAFYGQRMTLLPFSSSRVPSMAVPTAPISHRLWLGAGSVIVTLTQWSPTFLAPSTNFIEDISSHRPIGGWFQGDSSALHLLCTLFLLLLHHQALDPGGWELVFQLISIVQWSFFSVLILQWQFQVPTSSLKPSYTDLPMNNEPSEAPFLRWHHRCCHPTILGAPWDQGLCIPVFFILVWEHSGCEWLHVV